MCASIISFYKDKDMHQGLFYLQTIRHLLTQTPDVMQCSLYHSLLLLEITFPVLLQFNIVIVACMDHFNGHYQHTGTS